MDRIRQLDKDPKFNNSASMNEQEFRKIRN